MSSTVWAQGFVHINARKNAYVNVEQKLDDEQKDRLRAIKDFILEKASNEESSETVEDQERILNKLFEQSVVIGNAKSSKGGGMGGLFGSGEKITVTEEEHDLMKYYIRRDIIGYGPLEPLILDQYIEDVHLIGTGRVRVSHKAFQFALETNVRFEDEVSSERLLHLHVREDGEAGEQLPSGGRWYTARWQPYQHDLLERRQRQGFILHHQEVHRGTYLPDPADQVRILQPRTCRLSLDLPGEQDEHHHLR